MATRLDFDRTGTAPLADRLTTRLLAARGHLPPAPNGKPPRCSSPRAVYLHNELGAGRMKPFHALDDLFDCDLADGVPLSELVSLLDEWRASLEVRAVRRYEQRLAYPLPTLLRSESVRETIAQGKADPAQERVVAEPGNLAVLEAFAERGTRHYTQLGTLLTVTRRQIEVVRGTQARSYGARRPAMEVMK